jgi:hypothetical protein
MDLLERPRQVIEVADGFWNIRGSFKAGLLDIGTHASLVRLGNGKFVLLDACDFDTDVQVWIDDVTDGGRNLESFLHLHPFHTVFVTRAHQLYPDAKLYGTARHHQKLPELPWQELRTEASPLHELYADDFDFDVPRGVDFVSANPKLHFSSVLAFHPASKTLHVDDTIIYMPLPPIIRLFKRDLTMFHPALAKVLEPGGAAADEFQRWAEELIERAATIDNLCAAHTGVLLARNNTGPSVAERLKTALDKVQGKLRAHKKRG